MATAKLRVNPERSAYEIALPDGTDESGIYGEGPDILVADDGTPYCLVTEDLGEGLEVDTLYQMVKVETLTEHGVSGIEEPDEEEEEGEEDDEEDED